MSYYHECPCCTCDVGKLALSWSDREVFADPTNPNEIADAVISCAFDHSYDRTQTGVPFGFSAGLHAKLVPVVEKYLNLADPRWREQTVNWLQADRVRDEFRTALVEIITKHEGKP